MNSRRVQSWVWLLLPFLVARALLPMGFMAVAPDGKFQIAFCTAGYTQPHADAHYHAAEFACPFAQAAAAPLLTLTSSESIAYFLSIELLPLIELPYDAAGPPRLHRARGPPLVA